MIKVKIICCVNILMIAVKALMYTAYIYFSYKHVMHKHSTGRNFTNQMAIYIATGGESYTHDQWCIYCISSKNLAWK